MPELKPFKDVRPEVEALLNETMYRSLLPEHAYTLAGKIEDLYRPIEKRLTTQLDEAQKLHAECIELLKDEMAKNKVQQQKIVRLEMRINKASYLVQAKSGMNDIKTALKGDT